MVHSWRIYLYDNLRVIELVKLDLCLHRFGNDSF
jgi:hypothetical protein